MSIEAGGSAWRVGDPSAPVVDITVPYANENRDRVLLTEWRQQGGEQVPAPPLRLPRRGAGTYRARIWKQNLLDLFVEDQYSDAIGGSTGGPGGHLEDRIVTSVALSGQWRFTTGSEWTTAAAGTLCMRANKEPWEFEVAPGTRTITLVLPASEIRFPVNRRAVTAEQTSPAAALLLAQLRLWADLADGLGSAATRAARNATLELFRGLMSDQVIDDVEFTPALLRAAMDLIESRLLSDPDLDPRGIAASLNVSVRTLYRAFGHGSTSSVMGYVRERRLEGARQDLASTRLTVSEIAARWHFADSSHFVKAYKKRFAETPTAGRAERKQRVTAPAWRSG